MTLERRLAAILHADIIGYSLLMAEDETATISRLAAYREEIEVCLRHHGGRLVDFTGDNFLVEFRSAVTAVECALEIQRGLKARNEALPEDRRMEFRMGVNLGEVTADQDKLFGTGVNVAARIQSLAEPGGISISSLVHGEIRNRLELDYEDQGKQRVKNIPEPVRVFRVLLDPVRTKAATPPPRMWRWLKVVAASAAVLIAMVALIVWLSWPRPALTAIAVLPFENLGPPRDEYFAAGMTEEITSRLNRVSGLEVISRKGALRYASTNKSSREIGKELDVGYILHGSVRWDARIDGPPQVRITPTLIRVADDIQLWSETYHHVIDDIFEVQSDIAGQVIRQLGVTLHEGELERLTAGQTENPDAYTFYLKGRYFWNKRNEEHIKTGLTYFQQAIELDPGYTLAYIGIADTWIFRGWYSVMAPKESYPKGKEAIMNVLAFDETLAEGHASRAHIYYEFDHDWEAAEREFERAIELNPRYPIAHQWYGGYLSGMGRHEEALRHAHTAQELDPLSLIINTWVGLRHYLARRHEMAIQEYQRALELDPGFAPAHWHMGWAFEQTARFAEAISSAERAIAISGENPVYVASLGHAHAMAGNDEEAWAILDRLEQTSATRHVSAYHTAVIHAALGDTDEAFRWMDLAYAEQSPWIGYMRVDPRLDPLRSDPRFDALLESARLVF